MRKHLIDFGIYIKGMEKALDLLKRMQPANKLSGEGNEKRAGTLEVEDELNITGYDSRFPESDNISSRNNNNKEEKKEMKKRNKRNKVKK